MMTGAMRASAQWPRARRAMLAPMADNPTPFQKPMVHDRGMIYAIVDATALGFAVVPSEARDLVAMGEKIKAAAAEQLPAVHPENPEIHTINQTLFGGPLTNAPAGGKTARNAVIVSPGRIDRSRR